MAAIWKMRPSMARRPHTDLLTMEGHKRGKRVKEVTRGVRLRDTFGYKTLFVHNKQPL